MRSSLMTNWSVGKTTSNVRLWFESILRSKNEVIGSPKPSVNEGHQCRPQGNAVDSERPHF